MNEYHNPVLLQESVNALVWNPDGVYVDATFGGGGHSRLILSKLSAKGRLIAFDRDSDAARNAPDDPRFTLVHHNFAWIKQFARYYHAIPLYGILADLGISSHQIDEPERGFAHRFDGPLDMRMDRNASVSAQTVVNNYTEEALSALFYRYGEIPNSRKLASVICNGRKSKNIATTEDLKSLIAVCTPKNTPAKYLSQVYQAIRIEVNGEIRALENLLTYGADLLITGGKFVAISYHSLEDRLVKNFFHSGNLNGEKVTDMYGNINKPLEAKPIKAIIPTEAETTENKRARSAKMRIATKLEWKKN
jgi:16S rRNA (cytosine1402-N4)-methyltransferase